MSKFSERKKEISVWHYFIYDAESWSLVAIQQTKSATWEHAIKRNLPNLRKREKKEKPPPQHVDQNNRQHHLLLAVRPWNMALTRLRHSYRSQQHTLQHRERRWYEMTHLSVSWSERAYQQELPEINHSGTSAGRWTQNGMFLVINTLRV